MVSRGQTMTGTDLVGSCSSTSGSTGPGQDASSFASSASKVLALLEVIAHQQGEPIGVSELSVLVALPKSTTHRLLKVLEHQGLVDRSGAKYRISPHFYSLAGPSRSGPYAHLRDTAVEPIEWLFEHAAATVHLAVLDGTDVLYLEKITGVGGLRIPSRVGGRMPATCTALGKAILAFSTPQTVISTLRLPLPRVTPRSISVPRLFLDQLAEVRASGIAQESEEARLGVSCIAAPILLQGYAIAAISLSHVNTNTERSPHYANLVKQAAANIARRLPS